MINTLVQLYLHFYNRFDMGHHDSNLGFEKFVINFHGFRSLLFCSSLNQTTNETGNTPYQRLIDP